MGMLRIRTWGSFPNQDKTFEAMEHGHTHAVARAIEYLTSEVLPWAIARDHELHEEGVKPSGGFER